MLNFKRFALLPVLALITLAPVSFAQSSNQYQPNVTYDLTATVTNGTTTSAMVDLSGAQDTGGSFAAASLPSGINQLVIGDDSADAQTINGWEQVLKYWNTP